LHLAEELDIFDSVGIDVELVKFASLSDTQRAYINGRVDGLTSTLIEVVQAQVLGHRPLLVVAIPDYSDGGDVIVARNEISSVRDLAGKNVGAEISALGIYLLHRALRQNGLSLNDVNVINVEQNQGKKMILAGDIDAFVSYAPYSTELLRLDHIHTVFSSAEIPYEIVDTIAIAKDVLQQKPEFVKQLLIAWQQVLDYARSNPEQAMQDMAAGLNMNQAELDLALQDVTILNRQQQIAVLGKPTDLQGKIIEVCETLVTTKALQYDCAKLPDLVYRGEI